MISLGVVAGFSKATYLKSKKTLYSAIGQSIAPGIKVYKTLDGVTTALTVPISTTTVYKTRWSANGNYLAISTPVAPYLFILKRDGDSFTSLTLPSTATAKPAYGIAWHPDGKRLLVGRSLLTALIINVSGSTAEHIASLTPTYSCTYNDIAFSDDGNYIAIGITANSPDYRAHYYSFDSVNNTFAFVSNTTSEGNPVKAVTARTIAGALKVFYAGYGTAASANRLMFNDNHTGWYKWSGASELNSTTSIHLSPNGLYLLAARDDLASALLLKHTGVGTVTKLGAIPANSSSVGTVEVKWNSDGTKLFICSKTGTEVFRSFSFKDEVWTAGISVTDTSLTRSTADWVEV